MDIDILQSGSVCVLRLKGRFIAEHVREFDSVLESAIASGCIYLILALQDTLFIDSSGIGAVVNALRRTRQIGGDTKLVNPSSFVSKTFKMVGILSLFSVYSAEDEAIAACA